MNLQISDCVRWTSAAGTKEGTIKNLYLAKAGDNKVYPWICIEFATKRGTSTVTFQAGDSNLKAMNVVKVEKVNTKVVKNLMTGKMVEIDADTPRCCDPSSELFWTM